MKAMRESKSGRLFIFVIVLTVFAVVPCLCLYLDEGHLIPDPNCPFCNFLMAYLAIFASAALTFFSCQRLHRRRFFLPESWRGSTRQKEPCSIRGPPGPRYS
jgi:hypothetical protein